MRVFGEGVTLLKVGVALMALALALVIAAVVVSVVLRGDPEGVVAAEVAAKKSAVEAPRYSSSGEEGSATTKEPSSHKEQPPPHYTSGGEEEPLGYGPSSSSSSGGPVGQREEEPQEEAGASEAEPEESGAAIPQSAGGQTPSEAQPEPAPSEPESQPQQHQPQPEEVHSQPQEEHLLPGEGSGWAEPTPQEIEEANTPRNSGPSPPAGAIMGLSIEEIGLYNAPVYDSDSYWALANGIGHNPETSLPWSNTPQRNVFLAGHRMGFRGTWSRMIFYNLNKLSSGDRVLLEDRGGRTYEYEVSEVFLANPTDTWVMGQVRGRDMVTLQTCTPIPTFEKRLIVRADRV